MSHVAEGELHAWLDGALAHEAPEQAARVAAHLEACGDCRARLDRAREVRDRAGELLAAAGPEDTGLPPFEALAARAGGQGGADVGEGAGLPDGSSVGPPRAATPGRGLPMSPLRTLAWAASLLLGVGLGWAGRSAWEPGDRGDRLAPAEPAPAFEAASPETAVGQRGEDVDVDAAGRARAAGEADATAGRRKLADRAAAEGAPAEPAPERAAANEVKEPRTVADSVRPDVAIQPLAAARTAEANREPEERVWVPAGPADAARWVGGSLLLVEGLPVEDRAVSMGEGVPVTRVRQRLPSGALLEVHLRPAPEAGANRRQAARDAWTPVDGLEARLHGPVAPDSLAVLLSRLRAPAP